MIEADVVLSNADPKRTFLKLLDETDFDAEFIDEVRALKTQSASAKFLCALRELPDFSGHLGSEYNPKHLAMITLCPTVDHCESSWNDAKNGRVPDTPLIQLQIPSVYDETVAPEGCHVLSLWVYFLPPHIRDGSWQEMRQQFGERLIDEVSKYAPNFRDAIIDWTLLTPEDIEERIGLTDGNIRHLDIIPQQMMSRRPLPGWSDYRTPVEGLYLCGAGTHPGGEGDWRARTQRSSRRVAGPGPLNLRGVWRCGNQEVVVHGPVSFKNSGRRWTDRPGVKGRHEASNQGLRSVH